MRSHRYFKFLLKLLTWLTVERNFAYKCKISSLTAYFYFHYKKVWLTLLINIIDKIVLNSSEFFYLRLKDRCYYVYKYAQTDIILKIDQDKTHIIWTLICWVPNLKKNHVSKFHSRNHFFIQLFCAFRAQICTFLLLIMVKIHVYRFYLFRHHFSKDILRFLNMCILSCIQNAIILFLFICQLFVVQYPAMLHWYYLHPHKFFINPI